MQSQDFNSILQKHLPLDKKESVRLLVEELKSNPYLMTKCNRDIINEKISKNKVKIYFLDFYNDFTIESDNKGVNSLSANVGLEANPQETTEQNGNQQELSKVSSITDDKSQVSNVNNDDAIMDNDLCLPESSLLSKRYIYGTYYEMAFHNFFLVINNIYGKICGKDILKEEAARIEDCINQESRRLQTANPNQTRRINDKINSLRSKLDTIDFGVERLWSDIFTNIINSLPEEKQRAVELLHKHFPFLPAVLETQKDDINKCKEMLEMMSSCMRILRNKFAHCKLSLSENQKNHYVEMEQDVLDLLINCYDKSYNLATSRFPFGDDAKYAERHQKNFKFKMYKGTSKEKENRHISEFGLLFFASLFLEKQHIALFADKLGLALPKEKHVILEILFIYRIRMNYRKISSEKHTDAIALDILNELHKCPKELFDVIKEEKKKEFMENGESLMVRYNDRFPYLLMRYIDDAKVFSSIRFQVALGKYFYEFYPKTCIDSIERVRSLSKDVNGFGRLTEIDKEREEKYGKMIRKFDDFRKNTNEEKPYLTDHHANYIFNANRIALWISENGENMHLPELEKDGVSNLSPTCWLSIYELPALAFLLIQKGGESVEQVIISYVKNYKRFFNAVKSGEIVPGYTDEQLELMLAESYNLRKSDVPRKMINYLKGDEVNIEEKFNNHVKKYEIETLKNQSDKLLYYIGKKGEQIQQGKIANFIAHDIMKFQPGGENGKNKLTGLNFRVLHVALASFSNSYEELARVFRNAHLINNPDEKLNNPIVSRIGKPKNFIDFCKEYLTNRIAYLDECLNAPESFRSVEFLHASRKKWCERNADYYRALASRYLSDDNGKKVLDHSLELPRGIFDSEIREYLAAKYPKIKDVVLDMGKNMSYIINYYFEHEENDSNQKFYIYSRKYKLFDELYSKNKTFKEEHKSEEGYFQSKSIRDMLDNKKRMNKWIKEDVLDPLPVDGLDEESCKKRKDGIQQWYKELIFEVKKTEKKLVRYKLQDCLLFMLAKHILIDENHDEARKQQTNAIRNLKLEDIKYSPTLSAKERNKILSLEVPFSVSVNSANGLIEYYQEKLKVKDYAKFYTLLNDRRVPTLFNLLTTNKVCKEELEKEFDIYNRTQLEAFKKMYDFQDKYFDGKDISEFTKDSGKVVFPEVEAIWNECANMPDSAEKENLKDILKSIRNSYAHLSYSQDVSEAKSNKIPKPADDILKKLIEILNM